MKQLFLIILFLTFATHCFCQKKYQVTGKITNSAGSESLIGASISVEGLGTGAVADQKGNYSLLLSEGTYNIVCSYVGYESIEKRVEVKKDIRVDFRLHEDQKILDEITVTSKTVTQRLNDIQIGAERIEISEMAKTPVLFGERDIMKSIQLLPGVKSDGDGSSGFQVRGGTSSQNMILLDNAPVYNAGHLMGFFSTFNDEALQSATLYKGLIPAQLGGGASSVFDITTRSGDFQRYHVSGNIGLLFAKLNVEVPVVKDKLSLSVAGRRSYMDVFLKLTDEFKDNTLNFYDINAKLNWNINNNDKLFVSFFSGKDNLGLDELVDMRWGNNTGTIRWFHNFNEKWNSNTSLIYSEYTTTNGMELMDMEYSYNGFIRQGGLKEEIRWSPNSKHSINTGFQTIYQSVLSAEWDMSNYKEREQRDAWENTLWINHEWRPTDRLNISAGIRLNAFSVLGGSPYYRLDDSGNITDTLNYSSSEIVKTYFAVEPRLSFNYRIGDNQSIKAGYSRASQNIHAVRNSSISMPFDRYTMSSNIIKPQISDQVSLGYVYLTKNRMFEFSAEGYYKNMDNVIDYKDGKSFLSAVEIETLLLSGKGRSYGLELLAKKHTGRFTGWIAYTLSWSENKIEGINKNRWYTAGNDRRHDISVVGMYELSKNWHFSTAWVYNTGQALTAPSAKYEIDGQTLYYFAERNGYRAPAYHRLDVSFTNTKKKKNYEREWSFGIYNLYSRQNPYIIRFESDQDSPTGSKAIQYSLFGIIPSVSFGFKF